MAEKSLEAHLFECLRKGNTKKALYIVQLMRDNVNKRYRGKSSLVWAKKFNNEQVIEELEAKGAVDDAISENDATQLAYTLVRAAEKGYVKDVNRLIEAGADVNFNGNEPLFWAFSNNHAEIVEMLLNAGVNLGARDNQGVTLFMQLSAHGHLDAVKRLIELGDDINAKNSENGYTALMYVVANSKLDVLDELILRGVDVNAQNNEGQTALMLASKWGTVEVIEKLIKAGADVNARDDRGNTALMTATEEKHVECIRCLLKAGADVNIKDMCKRTALHKAIKANNQEMVDVMLEFGGDIYQEDVYGVNAVLMSRDKNISVRRGKILKYKEDLSKKIRKGSLIGR